MSVLYEGWLTSRSYSDYNPVAGVLNYYWVTLSALPPGADLADWFSPSDSGWMPGIGTGLSETSADFDYHKTDSSVSVFAASNVYWKVTEKPSWVYVSSSYLKGRGIVRFPIGVICMPERLIARES